MDVREALTSLRWSVEKTKSVPLASGVRVRMFRFHEAPSLLGLELSWGGQTLTRALGKEHVETRGKSMWFTDNTWRLSPAGVDFFAPGIEAVILKVGGQP